MPDVSGANSREAEVQVISERGLKKPFGSGGAYRLGRLGLGKGPNTRKTAAVSLGVICAAAIPLLLIGPPEHPSSTRSGLSFTGDVKALDPNTPGYEFPLHIEGSVRTVDSKSGQFSSYRAGNISKLSGPELISRRKEIKIPPGTLAQAILVSGGSNGTVRAKLTEAITINGDRLMEEGTLLLGQGSSTEERLFIQFTKAVSKEGVSQEIRAEALDIEDQIVGLHGSRIGSYAMKLAAGIGLNFITGVSEAMEESEVQSGVAVKKASAKNALYHGTAKATSEQAQEMLSSAKSRQALIEVPVGTKLWVGFGE